jgi:hypothetical protein
MTTQVWDSGADMNPMRSPSAPLVAAALALATPAAASAQLGLPLPPLPDPIQTVTDTLPDPVSGVVDTVTGTVGGVVDTVNDTTGGATGGVTDTIGQTVDQVLGGTLGELPTGTVDDLLAAAGLNGLNGANGANGQPGVKVLPDGTVVVDKRAPVTKVTVLNHNRTVGRKGKLSLRISSDEPSVVALVGSVKPGRAWKLHGKAAKRHSRKAIKIPKVVLAYRQAGALKLTIQFSGRAQRNIRGSYNSAVKLTLVAVDVARNQVTRKLARVVKH